jgi:hypothetical protein
LTLRRRGCCLAWPWAGPGVSSLAAVRDGPRHHAGACGHRIVDWGLVESPRNCWNRSSASRSGWWR